MFQYLQTTVMSDFTYQTTIPETLNSAPVPTSKPSHPTEFFISSNNLKLAGGIVGAVFLWEHLGRQYDINIRPSKGLELLATGSKNFFAWCGRSWAIVSSFLRFIKIGELGVTAHDLLLPMWQFVCSPAKFASDYFKQAATYESKTFRVYVGSGLLIVLFVLLGYKCRSFDWTRVKSVLSIGHKAN